MSSRLDRFVVLAEIYACAEKKTYVSSRLDEATCAGVEAEVEVEARKEAEVTTISMAAPLLSRRPGSAEVDDD